MTVTYFYVQLVTGSSRCIPAGMGINVLIAAYVEHNFKEDLVLLKTMLQTKIPIVDLV